MPKFLIFNESTLFVKWADKINAEIHTEIMQVNVYLNQHKFVGFIETIVSYTGLAVIFNPLEISIYEVQELINFAIIHMNNHDKYQARIIEIPTIYGGEFGLDLQRVAKFNNLTEREVIEIHTKGEYLCYMLGFAPGFAYLGGMDERIATPRLETPRLKIKAKSIGIAGKQTGIYPNDSPGGWNIIGVAKPDLFDITRDKPSLIQAGDIVRFVEVK